MSNLITLKSIQQRISLGVPPGRVDESTVRRLWWAALDTLQEEILSSLDLKGGVWLSSPLPALYEPKLLESLTGWVWVPKGLQKLGTSNIGLLPPSRFRTLRESNNEDALNFRRLPLRVEDGIDPLLIIITSDVQIALALQGDKGARHLSMRSDQKTLKDIMAMLLSRLDQEEGPQSLELKESLSALGPLKDNSDLAKIFWPLVSEKLAGVAPSLNIQPLPDKSKSDHISEESHTQISLLEAITHEVRTPLATIRTLIRSLLRRKDISNEVLNRLKQIDSVCTEQIDRFGLIFRAVELERQQLKKSGLARTDLGNMLTNMYPVWSQQLDRRGLTLKLDVADDLPQVLSDQEQLELMLGGLIDRNSRGLKSGSSLVLELSPAGHRLKLQIFSNEQNSQSRGIGDTQSKAEVGAVLSWDPTTGSLQLSQGATQRLLASLGGRLTNRGKKGLTVFFPVADSK